jgi:hypothetical protein
MSKTSTRGASASEKTSTAGEMDLVHTFVKNAFDEVWTYVQPLGGQVLAHVRIWTMGDDEEMRPTKKGITVSVKDVPKLAEAVAALAAAVKEQAA